MLTRSEERARQEAVAEGERELRALLDTTPIYKASLMFAPFVRHENSVDLAFFAATQLLGVNFSDPQGDDLTEAGRSLRPARGYDLGLTTNSEAVLMDAARLMLAAHNAGLVPDGTSGGIEAAIEKYHDGSLVVSRKMFKNPKAGFDIVAYGARWMFLDIARGCAIPATEIRKAQALVKPIALEAVPLYRVQA